MFEINTDYGYFIHLAKCALNGEKPKEKPPEVSFDIVYQIARRHGMQSLLWYGVEQLNMKPDNELMSLWYSDYGVFLRQTAYQDMELDSLCYLFTSNGFDVLPLKGSCIRKFYPQPDMRVMGDIDLLVKTHGTKEERNRVKELMLSNGYIADILDDGQVDGYKKADNSDIYVEIHFEFMHNNHAFYEHFIVDWSTLLPADNDGVYNMSDLDLYYFNIGHFAKNMFSKGIGVKSIADIYVMWNRFDRDEQFRLNSKLLTAGLNDFNQQLVKIAYIWFGNADDDASTELLQKYIIDNSAYGFMRNRDVLNVMKNESLYGRVDKKKYIRDRIFPSATELYGRFNIKHRLPFLLPFLWIARVFSLLFASKEKINNIKSEVENINDISYEEVELGKAIFNKFGLDYRQY